MRFLQVTLTEQGEVSESELLKYVLFLDAVAPQEAEKAQQTPNPDAQLPATVPPRLAHSVLV